MSAIICVAFLFVHNETFLPKWMTQEESLRIHEIGKGHVITAPPGGWVETPAEYEPLRGVWVTWDYGWWYNPIGRQIVREVSEVCKAYIIATASDTTLIKNYLISGGVSLDSVRFYVFPYNSIWIRDYGPWFIRKQDNTEGIVDFQYNRPRPADDTIPWRIGQAWGIPVYGSPLEHAGGNFMVDGLGTGFFSSLIYQENPGYTPAQIDQMMLAYNGLEKTVPLKRIHSEYTGHIDIWTKILNDTLVMVGEYAAGHPNDTILDNRADSIANCKNREGFPYRVVRIVMPWSLSDAPPTYLNSLFVNNKILVPIWGLPEDAIALATYQQYLPGYEVIGIDCSAMAGSGGAIHCITMQVPSDRYIHVQHTPLPDTNETLHAYRVRARIISSSELLAESTLVFYKINASPTFNTTPLSAIIDTQGVYAGYIPPQSEDDTVYYYLLVKNTQGIRRTSPVYVPPQLYSFKILPGVAVAEADIDFVSDFTVLPNPARASLSFRINLTKPVNLNIEVYNSIGQKVKTLTPAICQDGSHNIQWDLCDENNHKLVPGVYFYRITINNRIKSGKIVLVK